MTTGILIILYIAFILVVVTISFFMVTRLDAYSLDPEFTKPLITLYIIITVILVIINVALFVSLPFGAFFDHPTVHYLY